MLGWWTAGQRFVRALVGSQAQASGGSLAAVSSRPNSARFRVTCRANDTRPLSCRASRRASHCLVIHGRKSLRKNEPFCRIVSSGTPVARIGDRRLVSSANLAARSVVPSSGAVECSDANSHAGHSGRLSTDPVMSVEAVHPNDSGSGILCDRRSKFPVPLALCSHSVCI